MTKTKTTKKPTLSKKAKVLSALKSGKAVTRATALSKYNVQNLRATIAELRNVDGYTNIKTKTTNNGVKYVWA